MSQQQREIGRRLLPHLVDEVAHDQPERILYEFPTSTDLNQPWLRITARQFANSINRAAHWLESVLGRAAGDDTPPIGYVGPQDLRYLIFVVAAIKAGYVVLYTSPRNSTDGDVAVITAAGCRTWLVPSRGSNIHRVLVHVNLKLIETPDLEFFVDPTPASHYEYAKTWETGKRDLAWVLHTSGSTGHPKPVFRYLDSIASVDANTLLPKIDGRPLTLHEFWSGRSYVTFPFFHAAGLNNGLLWPLCYGATVVFGPELPVNVHLMQMVIKHAKPDTIFTAPSLVEEISKDAEFLKLLETVTAIGWGGGPVSNEAGSRIWKHTKLRLSMGMTETGWLPCVETAPEDWSYIHIHPQTGYEFHDRGGGLYELVAVRKQELERWQPIFSTFPHLQEYPFKDLFSRHPTKPDLYLYQGRIDNVIALSNGEKVQPNAMELTIGAHPLVSTAVIAGQGRFQTALLIEVLPDAYPQTPAQRDDIISKIWPAVEKANLVAPSHARILREFVIVASPDKPFFKTTKGTVRRGPTLELYQEELDAVYARDGDGGSLPSLDLSNLAQLTNSLRDVILALTNRPVIQDEDDLFFVAGMDSLQVLTLRKQIARAFKLHKDNCLTDISVTTIYRNPKVVLLSQAIWSLLEARSTNGHTAVNGINGSSGNTERLLEKYTKGLGEQKDKLLEGKVREWQDGLVVILTGSTGRLGSYVLDGLIRSNSVREIWCLNRSAESQRRQQELNASRGLSVDFQSRNVVFRKATLAEDALGLDAADYDHLLKNATHIIHTQWQVDFNLGVASFEPHIRGVRNLVDFAAKASTSLHIFFTSSVGVATNFPVARGQVPEAPIRELAIAGFGYGESKIIAETVLLEAAEKTGVHATVCRVGQIAGPVLPVHEGGEWNRKEWFPSIIDVSAYLCKVPETLGKNEWIDWIPVDHLASIVLELAQIEPRSDKTPDTPGRIFHAVNPRRTRWSKALLPTVVDRLQAKSKVKIETVPLADWVEALKAAVPEVDNKDEAAISAFKLVPFFEDLTLEGQRPVFQTVESQQQSRGIRELEAIGSQWIDSWLDQWGY
ncbi:hypothetical protein FDECE_3706 [Fusarium decemcellulare]|nr:hypothetical protein FDECE_3706 [Fusarium decemcellulare]